MAKRILTAICWMLILGQSVSASNTIVPGRTWWYSSRYHDEFGAHNYSRYTVYLGLRLGYDYQGTDNAWLPCYAINTLGEGVLEVPLALLKEEDNKIWIIPNLDLNNSYQEKWETCRNEIMMLMDFLGYWGGTHFWFSDEPWTTLPADTPYLLYDFDFEIGDVYTWPWSGMWMEGPSTDGYFNSPGCYVRNVSTESISEQGQRKVFEIKQDLTEKYSSWVNGGTIVEGIGITEGEFIQYMSPNENWFGFWIAPLSPGNPRLAGDYSDLPTEPELINVLEADGTCIYGNPDFNPVVASATVTENKIWDYELMQLGSDEFTQPAKGYHFSGIKEFNGHTYSIYRDGEGNEVAYMRQDGDKVYLCSTFPGSSYGFSISIPEGMEVQPEYLLYDFSCQPGDKFMTVGFADNGSNMGEVMEVEVIENKEIRDLGYARHKMTVGASWNGYQTGETFIVLEGVGPQWGLLCAPQFGLFADDPYTKGYRLEKVYSSGGECFFKSDFESVEVEKIQADPNPSQSDQTYYDLMGRPVAKPQPGSIYIRDGKKIIFSGNK